MLTSGLLTLDALESEIEVFILSNKAYCSTCVQMSSGGDVLVLKYMPASRLSATLSGQKLYASKEPGYTWGDALYVAPLGKPLSTMMYGDIGVVGRVDFSTMRVFNATDSNGIKYYQYWIQHHERLYTRLTTTIHSASANQELRNNFRTRFQIDAVCFRPDEECSGYALPDDVWLALTHWNATGGACFGPTSVVKDIEWCAISTEAFEKEKLGYRAALHPVQTRGRTFVYQNQKELSDVLRNTYDEKNKVVVVGF
jgi:hypothetical protein